MKFETILYEKRGHVANITLSRPDKPGDRSRLG